VFVERKNAASLSPLILSLSPPWRSWSRWSTITAFEASLDNRHRQSLYTMSTPAPCVASATYQLYSPYEMGYAPSIAQTLRPGHTTAGSQGSEMSYSSTADLVSHAQLQSRPSLSVLFCRRQKEKPRDAEKNYSDRLPLSDSKNLKANRCDLTMGWKLILFGSCAYILLTDYFSTEFLLVYRD
jgi:hypothetical protein